MAELIYDMRMCDGSRHFADLPETVFFDKLREHSALMIGAKELAFVTDWVTEVWLDFDFSGHRFSINNQSGEYLFFVADPECPCHLLLTVREHFRVLLET